VARRYDFEAKGRELADELRDVVRQRAPKQIVLGAHSLGGLVVIEALRQLVLSGEPERRAITRRVSALVFYGTPFLGSDRVTRVSALASPDLRALSRRKAISRWAQHVGRDAGCADISSCSATRMRASGSSTARWTNGRPEERARSIPREPHGAVERLAHSALQARRTICALTGS
jgi:esterase/lipase superfamily enzyme